MMKISKNNILKIPALCLAAAAVLSCTNDKTAAPGGEDGNLEIRLSGISDGLTTRVGTTPETAVNLVAFNDDNTGRRYFEPTQMLTDADLNASPEDLKLETPRYYPLGNNDIKLFAFSGTIDGTNNMELMAGNLDKYDYVLSNFGKRSTDSGVNDTYEGGGTPGSSKYPAELLQFRHVMTQLTVIVEVDDTQSNPVDPKPDKVEFQIEGLYENGLYPITSVTPDPSSGQVDVATGSGTEKYTAKLGVNYLVPTGLNLVDQTFSSLIIDDYKATDDDLEDFVIKGSKNETDMSLYPGYAYRLTLKIQKLRLLGVVLEQVDWDEKPVYSDDTAYDPHLLTLDITGGYQNSGDDLITRVVLQSDERRQYVGQAAGTPGQLEFVTLPPDQTVLSVDLYTEKGLLVKLPVEPTDYISNTLSLTLSEVGMLLDDPNVANSPANPYLVTTLAQFFNIEKQMGAYYRQETDLELVDLDIAEDLPVFTGFGTFEGIYDGNGYWIGDLNISCQGVFAANEGILLNIRLYTGNMDLSGYTYAGSLCGVNSGLIYGCTNEASLFGATGAVGGICGLNEAGGRIVGCVNTGNIRAGQTIGGICGENLSTAADTFVACLDIGNVSAGTTTTGAIVGLSADAPVTYVINTCYWLEGAVEASIGGTEGPVGTGDVLFEDTAGLNQDKMRNGIDDHETDSDRILNKLNNILTTDPDYYPGYSFVLDKIATGITWPMLLKL